MWGARRLRKTLLTAEVALTVVLLIAAGLLFKSFLRMRTVDLGCTTRNVLTMTYFLRGDQYSKPEQIVGLDTQLLDKVRHLPGVEAAGLTNVVPGDGYYGEHEISIPEHPAEAPGVHHFVAYRTADPGYFSAMEIPLMRGRFFSDDERLEHEKFVIVIRNWYGNIFPARIRSESIFAWNGGHRKGERLRNYRRGCETRFINLAEPTRPMMWFPILSGIPGNSGDSVLVVRSDKTLWARRYPIQSADRLLDADLPVEKCSHHGADPGRVDGEFQFERDPGVEFCGIVSPAGGCWPLRCARLSSYAANSRDRHPYGSGCKA